MVAFGCVIEKYGGVWVHTNARQHMAVAMRCSAEGMHMVRTLFTPRSEHRQVDIMPCIEPYSIQILHNIQYLFTLVECDWFGNPNTWLRRFRLAASVFFWHAFWKMSVLVNMCHCCRYSVSYLSIFCQYYYMCCILILYFAMEYIGVQAGGMHTIVAMRCSALWKALQAIGNG